MATVFRNAALPDYFVAQDVQQVTPQVADAVVAHYEAGRAILLQNVGLDYDREFLASLRFPADPAFKKLKGVRFVEAWSRGRDADLPPEMLAKCFGGDRGALDRFGREVQSVNRQLTDLVRRLFPPYRLLATPLTWRFTETVNENLHVDVYRDDLPDHHVRLFVNLDSAPRIWHTSYTLEYMLEHFLHLLPAEFLRRASPGRVCHDLNFAVFGGADLVGRDDRPRHAIFFAPGDVWLVDSRQVSHQIYWGRSAVSTDFPVAVPSMRDPERHYFALVERYRRALV